MPKKRFSAEQIVRLLRQIEVPMAQGKSAPVACRDAGMGQGEATIARTSQPNFHFDIFQFFCRFNPGTNGGNVEMGLINKSYLVTLNQRVPGSSPGAPTK